MQLSELLFMECLDYPDFFV